MHISEADVRDLVGPIDALEAVQRAHDGLFRGRFVVEPRTRVKSTKFMLASMSAIDLERGFAAAKVYSAPGAMVACLVPLFEVPSGKLLATIEGIELGRLRTAAAAVLAAEVCSGTFSSAAVIGAGYQGAGIVECLIAVADRLGLQRIRIAARTPDRARELANASGGLVEASSTIEEACRDSEAIFTATTAAEPVLKFEWLTRCRHISAVGSNSLSRRELPLKVVLSASAVLVDDKETAKRESGNLLAAIENGKLSWNDVHELGRILQNPAELPTEGYTLFCSHGIAAQDLALAETVYQRRLAK